MQDKITINPFDPDSIDEAIKKLEKRKERIHKCAEKLIQRLTDLGVEKAQELVPVDTGTARSSPGHSYKRSRVASRIRHLDKGIN